MSEFPRIAVINVGWSEDYQSSEVVGSFGWLGIGDGHEKYNFLPDAAGHFYVYAAPRGEHQSPPKPVALEGWLVFMVSKQVNKPGLYVVGWYEHSTFLGGYRSRPDSDKLGHDSKGNEFVYTLRSDTAFAIPLPLRDRKVSGKHISRPFTYLRGNGKDEAWREALATELLGIRLDFKKRLAPLRSTEEESLVFYSDPARRKEIEKKAEAAVEAHFKGLHCKNRAAEKCGYDLLFTDPESGQEIHVEVKGTALDIPHFFMTQREHNYGESLSGNDAQKSSSGTASPVWRLAVVHDIDNSAQVTVYTFHEMKKAFELAPYALHGTPRTA